MNETNLDHTRGKGHITLKEIKDNRRTTKLAEERHEYR